MTQKPEPWWPLDLSPLPYVSISGIPPVGAIAHDHPCVKYVVINGGHAFYSHDHVLLLDWSDSTDMLVIRANLLTLAYP